MKIFKEEKFLFIVEVYALPLIFILIIGYLCLFVPTNNHRANDHVLNLMGWFTIIGLPTSIFLLGIGLLLQKAILLRILGYLSFLIPMCFISVIPVFCNTKSEILLALFQMVSIFSVIGYSIMFSLVFYSILIFPIPIGIFLLSVGFLHRRLYQEGVEARRGRYHFVMAMVFIFLLPFLMAVLNSIAHIDHYLPMTYCQK